MQKNNKLNQILKLYAITDREWENYSVNLQVQIELAIAGGVTCIAILEEDLIDKKALPMAKEIRTICDRLETPLVMHDRVDIAIKSKVDGICISQNSELTIEKIKCKMEKSKHEMFIGVTVKSEEEAVKAQKDGADFLIARGVFQTQNENPTPITIPTLRTICERVDIPVIASGGVNKKNIKQLNGVGIVGAGVKTSIFSSNNIRLECAEMAQTIDYMLS